MLAKYYIKIQMNSAFFCLSKCNNSLRIKMESNYWHYCLITWNNVSVRAFHFV